MDTRAKIEMMVDCLGNPLLKQSDVNWAKRCIDSLLEEYVNEVHGFDKKRTDRRRNSRNTTKKHGFCIGSNRCFKK